MSTERPCHFTHLFKFKKYLLKSDYIYIYLPVFIHVYSPGAGADSPWGQDFYFNINLLSLVICCKFLPLNDFLTVFSHLKA